MKPEDFRASATRPFTGEEYLASLRDDREIYIYGDRVKDVTSHPAFRNAAASMARLYDALHDPQSKEKLCWETDTGNGGYTHKSSLRAQRRRTAPAARRHRRVVAADLRLDGPHPGLQGRLRQRPRRQPGLLRAFRGQRENLVQAHPGSLPVPQPCHRQPADRPRQAGGPGQGRVHLGGRGSRRRHRRQRRQGGRHEFRADPLQLLSARVRRNCSATTPTSP